MAIQNSNPNGIRESERWYVRVIKQFQSNKKLIEKEGLGNIVKSPSMGVLTAFYYDPKYKETLPLYDRFPLVVPFEPKAQGFLGLNMHYLPPSQRKMLFDSLMGIRTRKGLTPDNVIMVTYGMLKETARFPGWDVCIKHYLPDHIQSPFLNINPNQWEFVVPLPLQQFSKSRPY